jgi:hypothetical protein
VIDIELCCEMSFGGHLAKAAAAVLAAEANTDEELENSLAGINICDDDNHSDMSLDRDKDSKQLAEEVVSIASSAASMERKQLETRVIQLETQLLLERQAAKAKVASPNQILHEQIKEKTANNVNTSKTYNACQLWWIAQWVYDCKKELELTDTNERKQKLKSYVYHCIRNKEKKTAGTKHFKNAFLASASPAAARGAAADSD